MPAINWNVTGNRGQSYFTRQRCHLLH